MFWASKKTVRSLSDRIAQLEADLQATQAAANNSAGEIARLTSDLGQTPEDRTRALLAAVAGELETTLREQLERSRQLDDAAAHLASQIAATAASARQPRMFLPLGSVYRAETFGYVSLFAEGGFTDKVDLWVGDTDPPKQQVSRVNTRNQINAYGGTVVRPGEYWMATSLHEPGKSAVKCVYTPFH